MKKMVVWMMIAFTLVSSVFALSAFEPKVEKYPDAIDLIGSKNPDTVFIDLNNDGYFEVTALDSDDNMLLDTYMFDADKANGAEMIYYDLTGDGKADMISYDVNEDAFQDAWDLNADGKLDAYDYDQDGFPETMDENNDGIVDGIEAAPKVKSSAGGFWLVVVLGLIVVGGYVAYKKFAAGEKITRQPMGMYVKELFSFSETKASTGIKIGALVLNVILPGAGYFLLGDTKRAIVYLAIAGVCYLLLGVASIFVLPLLGLWAFCIIDGGKSIIKSGK